MGFFRRTSEPLVETARCLRADGHNGDGSHRKSMLTERSASASTESGQLYYSGRRGERVDPRKGCCSLAARTACTSTMNPHHTGLRLRQRALLPQGLRRQAFDASHADMARALLNLTQRLFLPHAPRSGAPGDVGWTEDLGPQPAVLAFRRLAHDGQDPRSSRIRRSGRDDGVRCGAVLWRVQVAKPVEGQRITRARSGRAADALRVMARG